MEAQIEEAFNSRIQHFKDNADSLTLESVRRLLEKDLGLEKYAIDAHKRFIKQLIEKHLEGSDDESGSKNALENDEKNVSSTKTEAAESPQKNDIKKDRKEPIVEDRMKTEDSPVMGLMTTEGGSVDAQSTEITESKIKKSIRDRASYIKDNADTLTPAGIRRLLEEDLGLPTNTLDPFKKFIRIQIDEVFQSPEVNESATGSKKKRNSEKNQIDTPEKSISETGSGSLDSENEEVVEKAKSRRKAAARENIDRSVGIKKRKALQKEVNLSSKKQKKIAKKPSDAGADEGDDSGGSDDLHSSEKSSKKKQPSAPGYGKRVENLKSTIKACGMSVAPSVYRKAKQVPDEKREGFLIKELEQILAREGLSTNPTEKEIKEVRKRKEKEKELEGIDLSNIVSSSRRRTATTYMAPPKPKARAERPADNTNSTKKNENEEVDDDNDVGKETRERKEEKAEEGKEEEKGEKDEEKGERGEKDEEKGEKGEKEEEEEEEEEEDDDDDDDEEDDGDSQSEEFNEDDEDSD